MAKLPRQGRGGQGQGQAQRVSTRSRRSRYLTAISIGCSLVLLSGCSNTVAHALQDPVAAVVARQLQPYSHHHHDFNKRQANNTDTGGSSTSGNTGASTTAANPSNTGASTTAADPSTSATTTATTTRLPDTSQSSTTEQTSSTAVITKTDITTTSQETTALTTTSLTTSSLPPTTSDTTTAAPTSQDAVTTIITTTLDNGSVMTSAAIPSATETSDNSNTDDEPSNHKAWIIPLSVVAGIIALSGILFLGYRCTQRRFSELEDDDGNAIRWPELMQRHGEEGTTLNPLATKRREGAGFDMDEEDKNASQFDLVGNGYNGSTHSPYGQQYGGDDGNSPVPSHTEVFASAGLGAPGMAVTRSASSGGSSNGGGMGYYPGGNAHNQYYDPYLGASGAPYPPPPRIMSPSQGHSPQQQGYYDPYQENPDYAPPSPHYPPPSRASNTGRSSPYQGNGGGGTPGSRSGSPAMGSGMQQPIASPVLHQQNQQQHIYIPYEDHSPQLQQQDTFQQEHLMDVPLTPHAPATTAATGNNTLPPGASPLPPSSQQQQHLHAAPQVRPMRLSVANPDDLET